MNIDQNSKPRNDDDAANRPHWLERLLMPIVAPHLREEVLGDLHERYALRVTRLGEVKARRRYWRDVLAYVRPRFIKRNPSEFPMPTNTTMLRNYLKSPFEILSRTKRIPLLTSVDWP